MSELPTTRLAASTRARIAIAKRASAMMMPACRGREALLWLEVRMQLSSEVVERTAPDRDLGARRRRDRSCRAWVREIRDHRHPDLPHAGSLTLRERRGRSGGHQLDGRITAVEVGEAEPVRGEAAHQGHGGARAVGATK